MPFLNVSGTAPRSLEIPQKEGNYHGVRKIDKKGGNQRHDDEGTVRCPEALCDRGHIGHGGRGRTQGYAAESGRHHCGIVAFAHQREQDEQSDEHGESKLCDQDGKDGAGQVDQGPELHTHQGHGKEATERNVCNKSHGRGAGRPMGAGKSRKLLGNQVGDQDAGKQAGDEQRQAQPQVLDDPVQQVADDNADMDGKHGIQKVQVADVGLLLRLGEADVAHFLNRLGRWRKLVAVNQQLGDGPSHEAGENEAEGGASDAYLLSVGDALAFNEIRSPGDGGAMAADQGHTAAEDAYSRRQAKERSHSNPHQILGEHESDGNGQEDQQRSPSCQEIACARVDADGSEEIHQQYIPRLKFELNRDAGCGVQQAKQDGEQQPAGYGLRYAEFAQKADLLIEPFSDKQHDDADGDGEKRLNVDDTVLQFHRMPLLKVLVQRPANAQGNRIRNLDERK